MKPAVHLSIPKPCHEKWDSFTPTAQGGFCASCEKEVIDFTSWSDEKIKAWLRTQTGNTCGRFRQGQLTTYTYDVPAVGSWKWLTLVSVWLLMIISTRHVAAQDRAKRKSRTEQFQEKQFITGDTVRMPSMITISGVVTDDTGFGMPGVNVTRKNITQGTITNGDGRYSLTIDNATPGDTLVFSFIGYDPAEYVLKDSREQNVIMVSMQPALMGEVIVLGGVSYLPWYSPKRWWYAVKNLL